MRLHSGPRLPRGTLRWWGCGGIELYINDRRLVIDPYLHPSEPTAHYICITHNDNDHCYEPTLEKLARGPTFERMFVTESCLLRSQLDSPVPGCSRDLKFVERDKITVLYPKFTREPDRRYHGPTEAAVDGYVIETVDSSERPERYKSRADAEFMDGTGPFVGEGEFPSNGYVVTETETDLTFFHPGDLGEAFDAQRQLRGRIDVLFLPHVKLKGRELTIIDTLRPKIIVPIHYRLPVQSFPIPLEIKQADLRYTDINSGAPIGPEADFGLWKSELNALMRAHFYPTPPEPALERLYGLGAEFRALGAELKIADAGVEYELAEVITARW